MRSGSDLGGIWAIVLGSHFWRAKSQRTFEYHLSTGNCLPSLGDVWASDLGAIWDRSGRSFWGVTFGRRNRSVPSSIIFQSGTVCPVWETSGRAIWERSGKNLGDRSGDSLIEGDLRDIIWAIATSRCRCRCGCKCKCRCSGLLLFCSVVLEGAK